MHRKRKKNGEVVGPAGGETGGPRCLAEAYIKLQKAAKMSKTQESEGQTTAKRRQELFRKTANRQVTPSRSHTSTVAIIFVRCPNCKQIFYLSTQISCFQFCLFQRHQLQLMPLTKFPEKSPLATCRTAACLIN